MELPKELKKEIWDYCLSNDITNIDEFIVKLTKQGFNSERYGNSPLDKTIEIKEKIVEKIIEIPKEIIVEKFISDEESKKLTDKINELEKQLQYKEIFILEQQKNIEKLKLNQKKDIYDED